MVHLRGVLRPPNSGKDEAMRRTAYVDDDYEGEVPDGGVVRVRLDMMDAVQRAVAGMGDHQPGYRPESDAAVRDARAAARDAREAMIKRAENAWRAPARDAAEPDAAEGLPRRHRPEPDDITPAARKERAYKAYVDGLSRAWQQGRTDSHEADRIERQGEQWRGGR
jgi:hypothetical protein